MSENNLHTKKLVLIADPEVTSIPIHECCETMIDLVSQNKIMFGPSPEVENNKDYTKMRLAIYNKLLQAQEFLPNGLKFCLYEAYRSIKLQKMLFEHRFAMVKKEHSSWSEKEIFLETIKMVSPIMNLDNSINIPPHNTGAAIDVYLIDEHNQYVEMGIHPKDWLDDVDGHLSASYSHVISTEATKNREIMFNALEKVGFINYPTEYWHWSYGDRYWAYCSKQPKAIYGPIQDYY